MTTQTAQDTPATQASPTGTRASAKAMARIVPLLGLCYLCAYMDRANVGFAALRMNVDLGFSATIYGLGAGLFFLGYALLEIPSNLMAVRFGPRRWLARIMIGWGVVSSATLFIHTPAQFYAMRFVLGAAEAGFWPGAIYYLAQWFPQAYRGRAVSRFYVASPLASLVMGAVSAPLMGLEGRLGLHGWQWLFLLQGVPSVAMGLALLRWLPDTPATAPWLTAPEKAWITTELTREAAALGQPSHDMLAALRQPRVLWLCATCFCTSGVMTTLSLSAPLLLVTGAKLSAAQAGWTISAGGVLGALSMLWAGARSDRHSNRFATALGFLAAMALCLLAMALWPGMVLAGYLGFATCCFTVSMLLSAAWADVLHPRDLAVGAATINMVANLGGFAMPFAWGAARDWSGGYTAGLLGLAGFCVVAGGLIVGKR